MNEFIGNSEIGVRRMRDLVFGVTISDESWDKVKENWMRPDSIIWLCSKVDMDRAKAKEMADL